MSPEAGRYFDQGVDVGVARDEDIDIRRRQASGLENGIREAGERSFNLCVADERLRRGGCRAHYGDEHHRHDVSDMT